VLCLVSRQELNNYRVWYRYSGTCSEIYSIWQVVFVVTGEKSQHLLDFGSSQGYKLRVQVLRHVTLCHGVNSAWCFGKLWCLHLQGQDSDLSD